MFSTVKKQSEVPGDAKEVEGHTWVEKNYKANWSPIKEDRHQKEGKSSKGIYHGVQNRDARGSSGDNGKVSPSHTRSLDMAIANFQSSRCSGLRMENIIRGLGKGDNALIFPFQNELNLLCKVR